MPESVERCVQKVKKTVVPRDKDQTKEQAAWAICTRSYQKKRGIKPKKQSQSSKDIESIFRISQTLYDHGDVYLANKLKRVAQIMDSDNYNQPNINVDVQPQPTIEPFAKRNGRTNKVTITFETSQNMTEEDIMTMFLNTMRQHGIKPVDFSWGDVTSSKR